MSAPCKDTSAGSWLRGIISNGYLHEGDQQMVDHLDPRYRPIVYDVAMSSE